MRKSLPLVVLFATAALVPAACGKAPVVPGVSLDAGFAFGALDGGAVAPGDAAPGDAAPMASGSAAPSASGAPSSSASAAPSVAPSALIAGFDSVIDIAMAGDATKDAPGMTPEGQPGRATLAEGGHFPMIVTLQPGRCYTIIAMSAPLQITELGVTLFALPLNLEAGRSGPTDKNPAVLGKGKSPTCPISPIAIPYKIDVVAKKGAGRMSVQLFSKSK